jgi:hypothetical protein
MMARLDNAVPDDHPVREIAAILDLSWARRTGTLLSAAWPSLDGSGVDDPDAHHRLRL